MAVPVICSSIGARWSASACKNAAKLPWAKSIERVKRSKSIPVMRSISLATRRNWCSSTVPHSIFANSCRGAWSSPWGFLRARCWAQWTLNWPSSVSKQTSAKHSPVCLDIMSFCEAEMRSKRGVRPNKAKLMASSRVLLPEPVGPVIANNPCAS